VGVIESGVCAHASSEKVLEFDFPAISEFFQSESFIFHNQIPVIPSAFSEIILSRRKHCLVFCINSLDN
jgi:hypothetical protein